MPLAASGEDSGLRAISVSPPITAVAIRPVPPGAGPRTSTMSPLCSGWLTRPWILTRLAASLLVTRLPGRLLALGRAVVGELALGAALEPRLLGRGRAAAVALVTADVETTHRVAQRRFVCGPVAERPDPTAHSSHRILSAAESAFLECPGRGAGVASATETRQVAPYAIIDLVRRPPTCCCTMPMLPSAFIRAACVIAATTRWREARLRG